MLNTAAGVGFGQVNTGPDFYSDCGIQYLGLDLIDAPRTKIIDYFDEGVTFIDECLKNNGELFYIFSIFVFYIFKLYIFVKIVYI